MMTLEEAIMHCEDVANDKCGCAEDCVSEHRQLADWLKELQSIVHCRECKHWLDGSGLCKHWSKLYGSVLTKADDFCSYGCRKERSE